MSLGDASTTTEYNILLLGETGVGKSTFINAFANYLTFETLDEAMAAPEVISLIPTKFTVMDDNFAAKEIISGTDENESFNTGASATQLPRIYKFPVDDVFVRVIDTPGIGDTRGIQKDEQNFDNLLTIIGQIKYLHAVCVLLKPNSSRLTVLFEYCIKQLLSRLERSAAKNIMFVFTNSRNTFYRPGDTLEPLLKVLNDIQSKPPNVKIPFSKENVFCMDNEAFRFLLAKKQGVAFTERDKEDFDASWKKSAEVCLALLLHTADTEPHKIQNTISVNEARRLILTLSEPLAIVSKNIEDNVQSVNRREKELTDGSRSLNELRDKLYVPVIKIRSSPLNYPRTVCADSKCTKVTIVENIRQNHYIKACHDPCGLRNVTKDVVGTPNIRGCTAFNGQNNCTKCGHIYSMHLHIYYVTEAYADHVVDSGVEENIRNKEEFMLRVKGKIEELKDRRMRLIEEKEIIQTAMAKFAHFLKNSAISIYNDKYAEYIKILVNNEKSKSDEADWNLIESYQLLIRTYEEKKRILDENLAEAKRYDSSVVSAVSADEIIKTVEGLYNLSICGPDIKDLYRIVDNVYSAQILHKAEKTYQPNANALKKFASKLGRGLKRTVNYFHTAL